MPRNTQRFRRIGRYGFDDLLKDLKDFESEVLGIKDGISGGDLQGPAGPAGVKGEPGARSTIPGPAGASGNDGDDGASAYDIAVENGFDGTEEEWLASLGGTTTTVSIGEDWGLIPADYGRVTDATTYATDYGSITE